MQKPQANHWLSDILWLTLLLSLVFFSLLASRPLLTPDEGRYAEIGREMAARGDYITPYLNGIKYFEKPVLFYWLGAFAIKLGGVNIFAVRAINAVIGMLGCLLTYATGRLLYGRTAGIIASLVLGTSTLYFVMSHMVSLDLPVTVFISASLYGFILATKAETATGRRWFFWGAAAASALAVLTKGLIGIVFPGMIAFAWMLVMNEWRQLSRLPIVSALVIFFLIAAPWHIAVNHYNPEFFQFYFIEQQFLRYTTLNIGHYQPAWFFIPVFAASFFPWIAFLPQMLSASLPKRFADRKPYSTEIFLLLASLLIFIFFSFSKSKLIPYILPVLPPLALLMGRYLAAQLQQISRGFILGVIALIVFSAVLVQYLWSIRIAVMDPVQAILYLRASLAGLLITSVLALLALRYAAKASLVFIISGAIWFLVLAHASVQFIDTRTVQPLAMTLNKMLQPKDEVITYNQYYQDLPFYIQRRVTILNWRNELTFGMSHQNTDEWMITTPTFLKRWKSAQRIYMIMSLSELKRFHEMYPHERIIIIKQTPTNALVTNRPLVFSLT